MIHLIRLPCLGVVLTQGNGLRGGRRAPSSRHRSSTRRATSHSKAGWRRSRASARTTGFSTANRRVGCFAKRRNPVKENPLGMLVPADMSPVDMEARAIVITYQE